MKISFDFDGTLEYKEVQDFAKQLIVEGYDVCILTTRYSDPSKYWWIEETLINVLHKHLFDVAKELGIEEIIFTEYQFKVDHIDKYKIDIHIDDNLKDEVIPINRHCKAKAVWYNNHNWIEKVRDEIKKVVL